MIEYTTPKIVYYSYQDKQAIFPASKLLESRWKVIRDEAQSLIERQSSYNVYQSFEHQSEEFWDGWSTYPLILHGTVIDNAKETCPNTMYMLSQAVNISTAFFSVLSPGKVLPPHYGPFKGVLRYHLGLIVPDGECYISVDKELYYWQEGEGILFDETYEHYAVNNTKHPRVILFIDVNRPLDEPLSTINKCILQAIQWSPHNQHAVNKYNNRIPDIINYDDNSHICLETS